ncbi:peptidoglycan-binding domain-containing protein [Pseudomonas sp. CNPSo 3701]|uniref:peptidoglycan-binding domain-containing protein n=1 Tax=Pseudomonas sp. CNPSo 3701 TaxID=3027943 RepID=UPI002363AA43|nr:peptidoglycan-binding domain-containing protein [Pseudomonas sp. CNPSo 3701]MDD1507060.1 peptidoglycan-binding domain-containing protein [Pseudomonas sp. CNPSo 3701]
MQPSASTSQEEKPAQPAPVAEQTAAAPASAQPAPQPVAAATPSEAPAAAPVAREPQEYEIQPGQCWVHAQVRPRPVQSTQEVVVKDSVNKITVTPAELEKGFKQVVTREGTKTYRIEPPTYRVVSEQVKVRPEVKRYIVVPAVYEDVKETVTLEEAKTVLDQCRAAGTRYSSGTGAMSFCARQVPAKQEVVKVKKLVSPETVRVETDPAQYKSVTRWIVDKPAQAIEVTLDPQYTKVASTEVVRPVEANQIILPEEKRQLKVTRFEGNARIVSRQTICDPDINDDLVTRLQQSLVKRGFNPGSVDGKLGKRTLDALTEFQTANGLAVGALTLESLTALEVQ